VKNKLDTSTANALILASVNTGFVVPFFNLMDNLDTSEIDVNLYGLNKLYASDQISNYYRHRYKLSLVVNHHVNMNDPKVQWFVSEFERQNGFLPSVSGYAMKGFDLSSFIGQAIQKLGKSFSDQRIQQETFKGLDSIFKFKKVNPSSGFENRGLFFIQYNDYSIVELNMFTPQN
jgi:ABC-type branched-subunit amino acid transport system substrate-binding protein